MGTISLVVSLWIPPINTTPLSVCQLVCRYLLSTKVLLVIHPPEEKDRQVVSEGLYPPHMRRPSMVWLCLSSGREGSEQDWPVEGSITSTMVNAPYPPDRMIPDVGMR